MTRSLSLPDITVAFVLFLILAACAVAATLLPLRFKSAYLEHLSEEAIRNMKTEKSDIYNNGGLRFFYSDGNTYPADSIYFNPSDNDIVCKFGEKEIQEQNCKQDINLETLSMQDQRTPFTDPRYECSALIMPNVHRMISNNKDARLRVLMGEYDFVKSCLTMDFLVNSSMPSQTLILDAKSYATKLFFLLRPVFIRGPQCLPVRYRIVNMYDSHGSLARIPLVLESVTDTRITGVSASAANDYNTLPRIVDSKREDVLKHLGNKMTIPVMLYYLNFVQDKPDTLKYSNVATAYITRASRNYLLAIANGLTLDVKSDAVRVMTLKNTLEVVRTKSALVIVTFTTSLVVMASMDPESGRVQVVQTGGMPVSQITTNTIQQLSRLYPPTGGMYPYTTTSIPNLADIALRQQVLRP